MLSVDRGGNDLSPGLSCKAERPVWPEGKGHRAVALAEGELLVSLSTRHCESLLCYSQINHEVILMELLTKHEDGLI